jgi:hypothetical protein
MAKPILERMVKTRKTITLSLKGVLAVLGGGVS